MVWQGHDSKGLGNVPQTVISATGLLMTTPSTPGAGGGFIRMKVHWSRATHSEHGVTPIPSFFPERVRLGTQKCLDLFPGVS